jgi:hypothetical protein
MLTKKEIRNTKLPNATSDAVTMKMISITSERCCGRVGQQGEIDFESAKIYKNL